MFSIIGEALNFGGRRLGLIASVAWLPLVLLLIVDMATLFSYASVIAGRRITFADVSSFLEVERFLTQYVAAGWQNAPGKMGLITLVSFLFHVVLVSTFIVPLIRYTGLGERPVSRFINIPFGTDQIRFILAGLASSLFILVVVLLPIAATSYFIMQYIVEALTKTMASFPDPESLHTIEIVSAGQSILEQGTIWIYDLAIPLVAAAPFALIVWVLGVLHFHPKNRPNAQGSGNVILRALTILTVVGLLGLLIFWVLRALTVQSIATAGSVTADTVSLTGSPVTSVLIFAVLGLILAFYFNTRLLAYPGVAVCQRSLHPGSTLTVSRGWNLLKLPVIVFVLSLFLLVVQATANILILPFILSTINLLFQATETSTRLLNSGVKGEWVLPMFTWIWAVAQIIINLFIAFFSYGVFAALYGRLYRDSTQAV